MSIRWGIRWKAKCTGAQTGRIVDQCTWEEYSDNKTYLLLQAERHIEGHFNEERNIVVDQHLEHTIELTQVETLKDRW